MGGGEVLRKGWLIKSPPLESGGIKNWRKRFFQLRSSKILEYYKSEDGDLKGVINLEDCKAVNSDLFHKKYKYVFDIETHDRVYYLVAGSAEEMKKWVDALCTVCGFTLQMELTSAPADESQSSNTMSTSKASKNALEAVITPPVSTLPHSASGVLFSDRFNPAEPQDNTYSLASAAVYDVSNQLGRTVEVPAGTPLTDALVAKGIGGPPVSSPYSQPTQLPESAYFSPRSNDVSALYSVPVKPKKQQSLDTVEPTTSTTHRALTSTVSDAAVYTRSNDEQGQPHPPLSASGSTGYRGAETLSNGYMRPSQWANKPRLSNYDYVVGPPRPAGDTSLSSATPHRSALLRNETDQSSSQDMDGESSSHTYINMKELHDQIQQIEHPPVIDRSKKPPKPSPPRVDRCLKPGYKKTLPRDDSPPDSPKFPTRTGSLSHRPVVDAADIPKPTNRTMQYTQVQFDGGRLSVVEQTPRDISMRGPVPVPRAGQAKNKGKRVNYSDIDIDATVALASASSNDKKHVSLSEAEIEALAEKPYVNVGRDGLPDEDTDPDYYTHMRDFPDSLAYSLFMKRENEEDNEDLYQEPSETLSS